MGVLTPDYGLLTMPKASQIQVTVRRGYTADELPKIQITRIEHSTKDSRFEATCGFLTDTVL